VLKALERETSIPMTELELLTVQGTFLSLNQRARDMAGQVRGQLLSTSSNKSNQSVIFRVVVTSPLPLHSDTATAT